MTPFNCKQLTTGPEHLPKPQNPGDPQYSKCFDDLGMVWCDYSCPKNGDDEYQNDGLSFCSYDSPGTFFPGRCVKLSKQPTSNLPSTVSTPSDAANNIQLLLPPPSPNPLSPSLGVASISQLPLVASAQPQNQFSPSPQLQSSGVASTACVDLNPSCATWASQGLCSNETKVWMSENCANSCNACVGRTPQPVQSNPPLQPQIQLSQNQPVSSSGVAPVSSNPLPPSSNSIPSRRRMVDLPPQQPHDPLSLNQPASSSGVASTMSTSRNPYDLQQAPDWFVELLSKIPPHWLQPIPR